MAVAALLCTAAACVLVVVAGLGRGDRPTDAAQLAVQGPAAGVAAADASTLSPTYPWPAFFAIGGDGARDDRVGRRREGRERTGAARSTSRVADRGADEASPDRGERRSRADAPVKRPSGRPPARVRVRDRAPRWGLVGDPPSRRRGAREQGSPLSAPAPVQAPARAPQAAPRPPAEAIPPSEPPEPADGDAPPDAGEPPRGETPGQGKPPGGGKQPRAGRADQR